MWNRGQCHSNWSNCNSCRAQAQAIWIPVEYEFGLVTRRTVAFSPKGAQLSFLRDFGGRREKFWVKGTAREMISTIISILSALGSFRTLVILLRLPSVFLHTMAYGFYNVVWWKSSVLLLNWFGLALPGRFTKPCVPEVGRHSSSVSVCLSLKSLLYL